VPASIVPGADWCRCDAHYDSRMYEMGQFIRLGDDPLTSRDGRHVLRYDDSGIATLTDTATGEIRWRAGAPGTLILGSGGVLHIEDPDGQPSWADLTHPDALNMVITDDGDLELLSGDGVRLVNSRTGAVAEPDPWEDWMWALMEERAYCATLIHGIEPADALRRLLGEDVKVHDATWQDTQTLLGELDRDWEDTVVAAFKAPMRCWSRTTGGRRWTDRTWLPVRSR